MMLMRYGLIDDGKHRIGGTYKQNPNKYPWIKIICDNSLNKYDFQFSKKYEIKMMELLL